MPLGIFFGIFFMPEYAARQGLIRCDKWHIMEARSFPDRGSTDVDDKHVTPFGARLRELREQAGLTQQQLAERAGIHKLTVAKFEQGLREPGWSTVQALVDALGVSCDALRQAPALQGTRKRGRPPTPKETEPTPKRPRGRPRKRQ
jgi:transcriptional regulator with XRE-family HTH domain